MDEQATSQETTNEPQQESQTRHEWLPEKFENPEALVKSYTELESKIGQKTEDIRSAVQQEIQDEFYKNRPASVGEYQLPETLDEQLAQDNQLLKWWSDHAFEKGLSQDQFADGINQYAEALNMTMPDLDAEKGKLGDTADQRIEAVSLFVNKFFPENMMPAIQTLASTAEGIQALEKIMEMDRGSTISGEATSPASISQADLEAMMKDPRYWKPGERSQEFVDKVASGFNKLYGS
tara:strand:- start:10595 stop:11302 length:708 start_codon:yes stop_codon:yes gene_type:complete